MASEQGTTGRGGRRGILAVAAAVVAGLAAKGVANSPPVAADGIAWSLPYICTSTSNNADNALVSFHATGNYVDALQVSSTNGNGVVGKSTSSYGVYGTSNSSYGVVGVSTSTYGVYGGGTSGIGVYGYSSGNHAVFGYLSSGTAGKAGVFGSGYGTGTYGVRGDGNGTGIGISGVSDSAAAVQGVSATGYGVLGLLTGTTGQAGVYGATYAPGVPAFYAVNYGTSAPGADPSIAGYFIGQVVIVGNDTATGTKRAAVPHPDGTHRLLYCMESPEAWFEDFGTGTISGGKAEVKLDPDFAAVVDTKELHVFLTPHGDGHHLNLAGRSATGFSVGAEPSTSGVAAGKKAGDVSGTFTYRVVAKRKDVAAPRLAKFEVPKPLPPPPAPPPSEPMPPAPKLPVPPKQ